jgi:3-oxoadipate enol-lactonase
MPSIQRDGATIGYGVDGPDDGTALLLYHGTTMDRLAWDMVIAALPADHGLRFVKPEFPGSGESSMPTAPLTVEELVADGLAVLDEVGVDRFHVAGYSLGAVIAAATAAQAGQRVASATLLCGWVVSDPRMIFTFDLWKRLIADDTALFMRYAVADGFTPGAIGALWDSLEDVVAIGATAIAPGSAAQLDLDIALDITPLLGSITAPTLVIGAEDDRWVDVSHSRTLAAAIPSAQLEILPAGHIVIQELAGDVARLLHGHIDANR